MDIVTMYRGRGVLTLAKSSDLIGIRPQPSASLGEIPTPAGATMARSAGAPALGSFEVVRLDAPQALEAALDELRGDPQVAAGTHVFHTPGSSVPYVPTGEIALRFTSTAPPEDCQTLIDHLRLEIVEELTEEEDDDVGETYLVRVTEGSGNPLKTTVELQASPIVAMAEPDLATPAKLAAFSLPTDGMLGDQWHLHNPGGGLGLKAGADARVVAAWEAGQSIGQRNCIVAVIDDGFDLTHPDISGPGRIVAPWDFGTNSNDPSPKRFHPDKRLADWHGTACAGVAVGSANGEGIVGAGPNCRLMPLRWGPFLTDAQIESWFAHATSQGAWVVSCSWGAADPNYVLSSRQERAIAKCARQGRGGRGCVVVFAAGNANADVNDPAQGTVSGFAIHPDVIAVAASTSRDQRSHYSNFGDEISVCAPSSGAGGRGVLTADVRGSYQHFGATFAAGYAAGDFAHDFGGTSSATPLVAGVAALMLSANPELSGAAVKHILEQTARRIGDPNDYQNGHSPHFGFGCVDAESAVREALASRGRPLPEPAEGAASPEVSQAAPADEEGVAIAPFWGMNRHETVATTAEALLTPRAAEEVRRILSALPGGTMTGLGSWADRIKFTSGKPTDPETLNFLEDPDNRSHRRWHYVNLPLGAEGYSRSQYPDFTRDDDIVQMIAEGTRVLRGSSSRFSELNALRWVTHLVGDVHQPLHVGCGYIDTSGGKARLVRDPEEIRKSGARHDQGGNRLLLPIRGSKSLHSYWDSTLRGRNTGGSPAFEHGEVGIGAARPVELNSSAGRRVVAELADVARSVMDEPRRNPSPSEHDAPEPEQFAEIWATDSLALARVAYETLEISRRQGNKYRVSWEGKKAYDARCGAIVSDQLVIASIHLADLLNAIWS